MTRIRLIVLLVLIVLPLAAGGGWYALRLKRQRAMLPTYEAMLSSADPTERRQGAEGVLAIEPDRSDVRLTLAKARIELGEYGDAREALEVLRNDPSVEPATVLALHADSSLREAADLIARVKPEDGALIVQRIKALVDDALTQRAMLGAIAGQEVRALVVEARAADVRSAMFSLSARGLEREIITKILSQLEDEAKITSVALAQARDAVDAEDAKLVEVAARIRTLDPTNQTIAYLIVQMHLRSGRFDEARDEAERLPSLKALEASIVGRIASQLLDLELLYGQQVTPRDIAIARTLIDHKGLDQPTDPSCELARLLLLDRTADPAAVQQRAAQMLGTPAFAMHPRVIVIYTFALIHQGRGDDAVKFIRPYNERAIPEYQALTRYALGAAYMAAKNRALADESLRQSLELDPESLPPRLLLAESVIEKGSITAAKPDIDAAARVNPHHPRVVALQARLVVAEAGLIELAQMMDARLSDAKQPLLAGEAAIVVAMVMDDLPTVQRLVRPLLVDRPSDALGQVAQAWLSASPWRRPGVAMLVMRAYLPQLAGDPLARPKPPLFANVRAAAIAPPATEAPVAEQTVTSIELLERTFFEPWPAERALEVVESSLLRWPDDPTLVAQGGVLHLWLGRPETASQWLDRLSPEQRKVEGVDELLAFLKREAAADASSAVAATRGANPSPVRQWLALAQAQRRGNQLEIHQALQAYLSDHPWEQTPLIFLLREAIEQQNHDQAQAWITVAQGVNDRLGQLTRARYFLAVGRIEDGLSEIAATTRDLDPDVELRRMAAEVQARLYLAKGRNDFATDMFRNLALGMRHDLWSIKAAAADVAAAGDKTRDASEAIAAMLADDRLTPYWRDRMLVRASKILSPERFGNLIDHLLVIRTDDPLLLLYQAGAFADQGAFDKADEAIHTVLTDHPDAPRALMALAQLAHKQGQIDLARQWLDQLDQQGGICHEAAEEYRKTLAAPARPDGVGQ